MNLSGIQTLAVSVIGLIGIVVLIALGKLDSGTGIPLIALIVGVHAGSGLQTPAVTPVTTTTTKAPIL
jgi:hypothetical protein